MPLHVGLAAVFAFVAAVVTVVVPWDPAVSFQPNPPVTAIQWVCYWGILAFLAVGLGRGLDAPITRLLPCVPAAVLLIVALADRPAPVLELGRMRVAMPAMAQAAIGAGIGVGVWYVTVLASPVIRRWLASMERR